MSESEERHARIAALYREIAAARAELVALLKEASAGPVDDVTLQGAQGPVQLSDLFGDHDALILSFHMGRGCAHCTCWGDAINGFVAHLERRAAFACISPDAPAEQQSLAASRGWQFRMVSPGDSDFIVDMGFAHDEEGQRRYGPGVATFRKTADGIERVAMDWYGPGDAYNGLYHLLELLPEGAGNFEPQV